MRDEEESRNGRWLNDAHDDEEHGRGEAEEETGYSSSCGHCLTTVAWVDYWKVALEGDMRRWRRQVDVQRGLS